MAISVARLSLLLSEQVPDCHTQVRRHKSHIDKQSMHDLGRMPRGDHTCRCPHHHLPIQRPSRENDTIVHQAVLHQARRHSSRPPARQNPQDKKRKQPPPPTSPWRSLHHVLLSSNPPLQDSPHFAAPNIFCQ